MPRPTLTMDTSLGGGETTMADAKQERLKLIFEKTMGHPNRPIFHEKVSVNLISWKPEHDDLNTEPEVKDLRTILGQHYGFDVRQTLLDKHKAQQQALRDLSDFAYNEDAHGALLIIYYAGHGHGGDVKPGDIRFEAKLRADAIPDAKESIVWSAVETAITDTEADVLLIFDCCYAGRLARPLRGARTKSYFQFLGACAGSDTTPGPGKDSFTTALIWSLEELAKRDEPFSTPELRDKIMEHEQFAKNGQVPVLTERRPPYEHIVISRKGLALPKAIPAPTSSERQEDLERREYIDLRFQFDHKVTEEDVEETATILKRLKHRKNPCGWSRVTFRAKSSAVENAAKIWRNSAKKSFSEHATLPPQELFSACEMESPEAERNRFVRTGALTPAASEPAATPSTPLAGDDVSSSPSKSKRKRAPEDISTSRQLRSRTKKGRS